MTTTNGTKKLHELLAVEKNYENQAKKTLSELTKTFKDKQNLFRQTLTTFKPKEEGAPAVVEEQTEIQTTVRDEIKWISPILTKAWDAAHHIDMANTEARADVVTEDGKTLLTKVPATALLRLEHEVQQLHDLITAIPTLDPAKGFTPDTTKGVGYYKAREIARERTAKEFDYKIMVPATDKHPAQVKELVVDKVKGNLQIQEWSSLITPALKADILDNVDKLARAIKSARSRANEQPILMNGEKPSEKLLEYVFAPLQETATK